MAAVGEGAGLARHRSVRVSDRVGTMEPAKETLMHLFGDSDPEKSGE